jgi:RHS repeat-associated protein
MWSRPRPSRGWPGAVCYSSRPLRVAVSPAWRCTSRKARRCHPPSHTPQNRLLRKDPRTCFEGPFGEVVRSTGPMAKANPFRFSNKYQDDETDLLYYGYRYYNASTGRWLSFDPVSEIGWKSIPLYSTLGAHSKIQTRHLAGISPPAMPGSKRPKQPTPPNSDGSLYSFCRNDPLGVFDLWGLHIYLQRGNNSGDPIIDRLHMSVCVDTYNSMPRPGDEDPEPVGRICFTFGVKNGLGKFLPVLPGLHWLGFSLPHPGSCLRGVIYVDTYTKGAVVLEMATTPVQDWKWQTWMQGNRVGTEDAYMFPGLDCIQYSIREFAEAPRGF